MNIYLAGRWSQKEALRLLRSSLTLIGHQVTSRWLDLEDRTYTPEEKPQQAINDCQDIDSASLLIAVFQEGVTGYQGTFFEIGLAMGIGIPVVIVGETTCVFRYLPTIRWYPDWLTFQMSVDPLTLVESQLKTTV